MRSQLPTGSGDALAEADEPPLTAQREAEGDLLGRVERGVESAHGLERRARAKEETPEGNPHPLSKPNLNGHEHF